MEGWWLGASDADQEGRWLWLSDLATVEASSGWVSGEPNNVVEDEHCMMMGMAGFSDVSCSGDRYFVCD